MEIGAQRCMFSMLAVGHLCADLTRWRATHHRRAVETWATATHTKLLCSSWVGLPWQQERWVGRPCCAYTTGNYKCCA